MKNNSKINDEEKVNDTKSNISQNESHQPLNSDFQQNINFRLLNQNHSNLYQKNKKHDQSDHKSKNSGNQSSISSQKRIQSNIRKKLYRNNSAEYIGSNELNKSILKNLKHHNQKNIK